MNGMCCLGDNDDPGIRICIGEEGGMNDRGSRSDTSDDKGRRKNLAAHDSNSLWTVIWRLDLECGQSNSSKLTERLT